MSNVKAKIIGSLDVESGVSLTQLVIQDFTLEINFDNKFKEDLSVLKDGSSSVSKRDTQEKIPLNDFKNILGKIRAWAEFVKTNMKLNPPLTEIISNSVDTDANGVNFTYKLGADKLVDGSWDKATDNLTFKTRKKIDLKFGSLILWVEFMESVLLTIERAKK